MARLCCSARIVAVVLCSAGLTGCGSVALFGKYDLAESPEVAAAPWPKLIDTPAAPPVGVYTPSVPDPAEGAQAQKDLGFAAAAATSRAAQLARPVAVEAEPAPSDLGAAAEAAAGRAAELSAPVISDAERAAMLEAARRQPTSD